MTTCASRGAGELGPDRPRMEIDDIVRALHNMRVRITDHADEEALADRLSFDEIACSVVHREVLEAYPADRPYPGCLIYGDTPRGDPVHSVWAYNQDTAFAVLSTTYRADPERWIDWRRRRTR